ncbi:MAG: hypothetical protein WCR44_04190 [Verrucomicrobiota bacterium]
MRKGILFFILLLLLPIAVAFQDLLPAIPPFQARILLLPVVFCFGVMALPLVPSLFFALATALVQGLVLLQIQSGQAELGLTVPVVFFLVWAIVLQMASEATHGMRWEVHALGSAVVTLTLLGVEFVVLCVRRGGFPLEMTVLLRIVIPSVASLLVAPLLYLMLRKMVPVFIEGAQLPPKPNFSR